MEEGPEPQELMEHVEHTVDEKEEGGSVGKHRPKHMKPAVAAAVLAVGAAIGSLLSGHAANEAILKQSQASDKWSYYQAKSTKSNLYEVNRTLLESIIDSNNLDHGGKDASRAARVKEIIDRFKTKTASYDAEKKQIEGEARALEEESNHAFAKHQMISFAVACFQIGIVVASVSILIDSSSFLIASIVAGVVGLALLAYGSLFVAA